MTRIGDEFLLPLFGLNDGPNYTPGKEDQDNRIEGQANHTQQDSQIDNFTGTGHHQTLIQKDDQRALAHPPNLVSIYIAVIQNLTMVIIPPFYPLRQLPNRGRRH